jgi:hypothetical protein
VRFRGNIFSARTEKVCQEGKFSSKNFLWQNVENEKMAKMSGVVKNSYVNPNAYSPRLTPAVEKPVDNGENSIIYKLISSAGGGKTTFPQVHNRLHKRIFYSILWDYVSG